MKRHPYITVTVVATMLAVVVWMLMPKDYAALTKISDEYKEMDLAVGLNMLQKNLKKATGTDDGINNMEVYGRVLKTRDFARQLSLVRLKDKGMSYGEWVMKERCFWESDDTFELISDKIEYNLHTKSRTIDIQLCDRDGEVAARMLNATLVTLRKTINVTRKGLAKAMLDNARKNVERLKEEHKKAQAEYCAYADSHMDITMAEEKTREGRLKKKYEEIEKQLDAAKKELVRQEYLAERDSQPFAVVRKIDVPLENTSRLWVYVAVTIIIGLLATWLTRSYLRKKADGAMTVDGGNIFSPWTLTFVIWAVIIVAIQFVGSDLLYPLTEKFYKGIVLWVPTFCVMSFVTYNLTRRKEECTEKEFSYNELIFNGLLFISVLFTPLVIKKILDLVLMFGSENLMSNIRTLMVKGEADLGFLSYCFVINKVLLLCALWNYKKIAKWKFWLTMVLMLMSSFAVMDKTTLFFVIVSVVFYLYEKKKINLWKIGVSGVFVVGLFFVLTLMRAEEYKDGTSSLDNLSVLEFVGIYVLSTPVAFGYLTQSVGLAQFGNYSLSLMYLILAKMGFNVETLELVQDFVYVPIPTNLYTIMQPFYADFGYGGIAFFAMIYGVMAGWLYKGYKEGNSTCKLLYTYLLFFLVMQFGQEGIFMAPIITIQFALFCFILTQKTLKG